MPHLCRSLRLVPLAALGAIISSCATTPVTGTSAYELTDLTGAYVALFDRTQDLATDARVAAFKAELGARFPGFYDVARMPGTTPEQYDADIARSFTDFPQRREAFTRTAASFQSMLRPAIDSFVGTFDDFRSAGHIALVHSLGETDGGTRTVNGKTWLVFGAVVMARLYLPGSERPFFHHELFHVYNAQFFDECGGEAGREKSLAKRAGAFQPAPGARRIESALAGLATCQRQLPSS